MSDNKYKPQDKFKAHLPLQDRRRFIKTLTIGGFTMALGGVSLKTPLAQTSKIRSYSMIIVDYDKCTGCRTCEAVCSQQNNPITLEGETIKGLGNPHFANIRVFHYEPDVDVPSLCKLCSDAPCIDACPVPLDKDGRKALYRDEKTGAIKNNPNRCIGCASCAETCKNERTGAIVFNTKTNRPERMCTLCGGDPQCVSYCPYGALTFIKDGLDGKHYADSPEKIAEELIERWYGTALTKGENVK